MSDRDAITKAVEAHLKMIEAFAAKMMTGEASYIQAIQRNAAEAIAALTALQEEPAPVAVGDDGSLRWAALRLAQEADIDGLSDRAGWDCWVALVKSRSALQPSPAREEAEELVKVYGTLEDDELRQWIEDQIIPFIAHHHLGEKS